MLMHRVWGGNEAADPPCTIGRPARRGKMPVGVLDVLDVFYCKYVTVSAFL